jgi:predicted O-methyltransferase YrrM
MQCAAKASTGLSTCRPGGWSIHVKANIRRAARRLIQSTDLLLALLTYPAAWLLKIIRRTGVQRLPHCRRALMRVGVFPLLDHYYEPQFAADKLRIPLSEERLLPGISWNVEGQLDLLDQLTFSDELTGIPATGDEPGQFYMKNGSFESGDAEYLYQIIRLIRPRRLFEIGSGHSTLAALRAIRKNRDEDATYDCKHICIEPYEMPWLERTGVQVIRKRVEDVGTALFSQLRNNDILFIDSSHVIRPQGDVLFEYLELLPTLADGVIVHIHDIFSPRNYPPLWIVEDVKFWNEQYVLEAFLSNNHDWRIIGALNYLRHNHYDRLKAIAPYLTPDREPGSFYIQKVTASAANEMVG